MLSDAVPRPPRGLFPRNVQLDHLLRHRAPSGAIRIPLRFLPVGPASLALRAAADPDGADVPANQINKQTTSIKPIVVAQQ